jgi:nucleoside-diphosphate-sugar epimerase
MNQNVAFVTGATGFVGSHLARRLLREGAEVHILTRAESNFHRLEDVRDHLHAHQVSLAEPAELAALLQDIRPRHVYHLAASTIVAGATGSASDLVNVNLLGTINLIEALENTGYQALITTGDSFEYAASHAPLRESGPCAPHNLHGISKLSATLYGRGIALERGRPILTLRLFSTYGPWDNPRRLVPRVITGALTNTPIKLSRREISRDWIYIDDVVDLYLDAAAHAHDLRGGVFNAGSGHGISIGEITERLITLTGSKTVPQWGVFPAPAHDDTPWIADMSHTFRHLSWRPKTTLYQGMMASIEAIRATL